MLPFKDGEYLAKSPSLTHHTFMSQRKIITCHVRHIFMPVDQTIKKIIYLMQQFVKCNNSFSSIKDGCCKTKEKCWIVATINPISCSYPVPHGTFFNVLIGKIYSCKCREIIIVAHNYFKNKTQTKQHFVFINNRVYVSLD